MTRWSLAQALGVLGVRRIPFDLRRTEITDGDHGWDWIAVSPTAEYPKIVALRELAGSLLNHDYRDPVRESIVAEHAALLVADLLKLPSNEWDQQGAYARLEFELGDDDPTQQEEERTYIAMVAIMNAGIGVRSYEIASR